MKYLHKFSSLADFEAAYNGSDYLEPWVSITPINENLRVDYNKHLTNADFDLVVDYAQGENDNYAIVQSKDDIHILSKENDGYSYIVDNDCSILPSNVNEGQIINVRILNYHGETVDLSLEFWDTGSSVEAYAWSTISYENNTDYVVVYAFDDGENPKTVTVSITRENPFT